MRNRATLLIAAAVSGAALMAVEFAGQRILAVHWGDSVTVWGAAIATVLGGLTLGYAAGGRLADARPVGGTLAGVLVAGATGVLAVALLGDPVAGWLVDRVPGLRSGALLGSLVLLLAPSVLLGMTSPVAARLAISDVAVSGRRAGDVYAAGSLGSIAGALGATFWLIEALGTRGVLAGAAAAVAVPAVTVAVVGAGEADAGGGARVRAAAVAICVAAVAAALAIDGTALGGEEVVEERDTEYAHLRVIDDGGVRTLWIGALRHSAQRLDDPDRLVFTYTRAMQRALCAVRGPISDVAMIGVGGGSMVRSVRAVQPSAAIAAVDVDPGVIEVAHRWFGPPREGVEYVVADGRRFLAGEGVDYDLVLLDAYGSEHVPPHLLTREFFAEAAARVASGGALALNLIAAPEGDLARDVATTMRTAFGRVDVYDAAPGGDGSRVRNLILVAGEDPSLDVRCLRDVERVLRLPAGSLGEETVPVQPGRPLTDDRPPVLAGG